MKANGSETEAKNVAAVRAQLDLFNNLAGVSAYNATDAVFHAMAFAGQLGLLGS